MHSTTRSVALVTLLTVLPFGGVRVICVAPAPAAGHAVAGAAGEEAPDAVVAAADEEPLSECERLCPYHPPAEESAAPETPSPADATTTTDTSTDEDCALSSDGAPLTLTGAIAVLRAEPVLAAPDAIIIGIPHVAGSYVDPALTHTGPPPKPLAV